MSARVRELIFLGTGTSSCVPNVRCLVHDVGCKVCPTTVGNPKSKNRRRNTSLLVRIAPSEDCVDPDKYLNVVIDAGKTFYDSSVQWFTEYGIKSLDAVVLTHPHADAMHGSRLQVVMSVRYKADSRCRIGLDDLRSWTFDSRFRTAAIPVHLHKTTLATVATTFPYIVHTDLATGGGGVPALDFIAFDDSSTGFDVCGVQFVPIKVHHGLDVDGTPFYSWGYRFGDVSYVSDASLVPDASLEKMRGSNIVIMDALRELPHVSHFGYAQCLDCITSVQARYGLMTGFTHALSHEELQQVCDGYLETGQVAVNQAPAMLTDEQRQAWHERRGRVEKLAPAHDGLRIVLPLSSRL
ncbi:hypothetical protein RI367_002082 [Sorochytrium milnesiophthora]